MNSSTLNKLGETLPQLIEREIGAAEMAALRLASEKPTVFINSRRRHIRVALEGRVLAGISCNDATRLYVLRLDCLVLEWNLQEEGV